MKMKTLVVACIALSLFVYVAHCHEPNKRSPKETNPSKRDIISSLRSSLVLFKNSGLIGKLRQSRKRAADSDITEEEIDELRERFNELDENDDDVLTKTELLEPAIKERIEAEAQAEMNSMDTNGDGTVDFDEYLSAMTGDKGDTVDKMDLVEFCYFMDENDNGFISPLEFKNGMAGSDRTCSDEELNKFIEDADHDGDGKMDCNEFVHKATTDSM